MMEKMKKPIYKRWWFLTLAGLIALGALGSIVEEDPAGAPAGAAGIEPAAASSPASGPDAEEFLFREGDFALLELSEKRGEFGERLVIGAVKNLSSRSKGYAQIEINLLNAAGDVVGSTLANVNNLDGGQTWRFEAPVLTSGHAKLQVKGITGF